MRSLSPLAVSFALVLLCPGLVLGGSIVIADQNPDHYWTFDSNADDSGVTGGADGTLVGASAANGASLLLDNTGNSLWLDGNTAGGGSEMQINNDPATINGSAADDKTISFAFRATSITGTRGVIWEQGGATRGISIYVEEVGGEDRLYMAAWNQSESNWGNPPVHVFTPIDENTTYHAAMVLVGDPDNDDNTDDGNVFGYLNGVPFGSAPDAGNLRTAGNNNAVGGINENVRYHDNSTAGDGDNFIGLIDEMAHWHNVALTEPQIAAQAAQFVPEPSTAVLAGLGLLVLLGWGRRRSR